MQTTYQYDHYFKYEEMEACLQAFAQHYPDLTKLESLYQTPEKREVWAITLTNHKTGTALSKPAFYIDGNTHAGEVTGSMAAMHTMDYLLTQYGKDAQVTALLDTTTIYFIPRISPDGAETYLSTAYSLRSVNRPYHTKEGGLTPFDLDDDGVLRMMRVKNPYGAWKKGSRHSLVMEKRLPDDTEGEFYNVYLEGLIEKFDGVSIPERKALWGLDFNRNYPFGWFSEVRQSGAGKYPLSNPENKAVVDFVLAHPNIGGVATMHTSGGVILYPPGTQPEKKACAQDMEFYREIGKMAKVEMGYETINIFDHFMVDQENYSSGAFDDWCYQTQGILAYTLELWNLNERAGQPTDWSNRTKEGYEKQLEIFLAQLNWCADHCPDQVVDWQEVDHPQLKKVEIGGLNVKFTVQNCPNDFLLQEVEKTTRFVLRFAKALPKLKIDSVTVKEVGQDMYRVEALVSNAGYLPTTVSLEAKLLEVAKPIRVSLEGDYTLISGDAITEIEDLAGFGQIKTEVGYSGGIETHTSADITKKVSWIVKANAKENLKIVAFQEKSGKATYSFKI